VLKRIRGEGYVRAEHQIQKAARKRRYTLETQTTKAKSKRRGSNGQEKATIKIENKLTDPLWHSEIHSMDQKQDIIQHLKHILESHNAK